MGSTSPPPGWYRDPASSSPQLRYWDGRAWSAQFRPYDPPSDAVPQPAAQASRDKPERRSRLSGVKWGALGFFAVGAVVAGIALANGQAVKDVDLATGKVSFYSDDNPEEIEQVQPEAETVVADLEQEAREQAAAEPDFSGPDLSGTWRPVGGTSPQSYEIVQYGDQVVVQEVTPWGITAAGSGTIVDGLVAFSFTSYDGNSGFGELQLVGDSTLQGTLTSNVYGATPVRWQKASG